MENQEKVYTYQEFIASIDGIEGNELNKVLTDISAHLKTLSREKYQAWRDSGFQTGSNGNRQYAESVRLAGFTDYRKKPIKVYRYLAELLDWETRNAEMAQHEIDKLMQTAPSGSGVDSGTKLNDESTAEKILLDADFHHMNDGGMYDGWTVHTVIVTPSLQHGFKLRITGQNRNEIKDRLHEDFEMWLNSDYEKESGKLL